MQARKISHLQILHKFKMKLFACFAGIVFTFLVCNSAGSFASGLTGSLAFAATALCTGLFKICSVNGFDVFHYVILQNNIAFNNMNYITFF